jgi:hypothetical protein
MSNVVDGNFRTLTADLRGGTMPPDNGAMDARLTKLEGIAEKTSERLVHIDSTMATKADVAEVRGDIQRGINETQKWMMATVIGLFVGFGGLFLAMSNGLKPPASQSPIIINVPAQAPATPPVAGK